MEDLRTTVGNLCLSTNALDMKECDAPESKRTSAGTELIKNIRLIINLLHADMVHMPLERIGLGDSIPVGLWAVCGIVPHVLALETLDVTQVLWCLAILTVVSIASIGSIAYPIPIVPSIAIAIPVTIVVVVAI